MLDNHNNSSFLSDSLMGVSTKSRHHKKSIYKNIKQTQLNLKQIKRYEERNILPFSLKQQQQQKVHSSSNRQQQSYVHGDRNNTQWQLRQSDLSQKLLKRFQSRNQIGFKNQDTLNGDKLINDKTLHDFGSRYEDNILPRNQQYPIQNSKNNQTDFTNANLIMLQIHLTIAKKKYTIKVSNQITSLQLQHVIENFLIQNSISNPGKKSHLKTKRSIIEMVENKIKDGNNIQYRQLEKYQKTQQMGNKVTNENFNQENHKMNQEENKIKEKFKQNSPPKKVIVNNRNYQKPHKIQKPPIQLNKQNLKKQNDSINYQQNYEEEQACSPSFKSSAYVEKKSPIERTSHFSPQPKHKKNKYEKIVTNYYNQTVKENFTKQKDNQRIKASQKNQKGNISKNQQNHTHYYSHGENQTVSQSLEVRNLYPKKQQSSNFSQYQTQQQKAKSVYEKWKQRQKSKQIKGKPNDRKNFTNALKQRKQLTENSFVTQMSEQKKLQRKEKNWNNGKANGGYQKSNLSINTHDIKDHQIRPLLKSPVNKKKIDKENLNVNKSLHSINKSQYHQRNKTTMDEDYSPNRNMNRTQIVGSRKQSDNEVFETNKYIRSVKETIQRAKTPNKARMSTNQPKTPTNNPNNSKVYTIYDEDQYPIHQMSPDHFYKQGLVFQAKKKQQIQHKFKSLYPFTTRNIKQSNYTQNGGSRNVLTRNIKENNGESDRSKDKYFSSKLSMNNNNIIVKSSANIILDQSEKSALHQRLYRQNKTKQAKITATEASQRLIKIAKAPQSQNQIKIMQENLKHLKGLSQEKKVKLIERNIKIKQKIKEKDRIIDQQLQKMIKQGKVKPTCQIVQVRKSPFRKTKIF